jgi:NADH-quinone oxidoreductase subunit C
MHNELVALINKYLPEAKANVSAATDAKLDSSIYVESSAIYKVMNWLRTNDHMPFNALMCITGIDYLDSMDVCYVMGNFDVNAPREVIIKAKLTDRVAPMLDSVVKIYAAANFLEREVYDMFGIRFNGHPDLRRILCPDDWKGWPSRRDYVAQKFYNGMEVYPDNKMNFDDREFIVRQDMIKKAQTSSAQ